MKERLRRMFLEMLNQQLKTDHGISTRMNLYMVEVMLTENLLSVFTGIDSDADDYYELHDEVCDFIDRMHKKYDC